MYRLIVFKIMINNSFSKNMSEGMSYKIQSPYLNSLVNMLHNEEKDKLLRCIEKEGETGAFVYIIGHEISRWNDSTGSMLEYILEKVPGDSKQEVIEHVLALLKDSVLVDEPYIKSFVDKYINGLDNTPNIQLIPREKARFTFNRINYNNFKRHDYTLYWWALKYTDGTIEKIYLTIHRDDNGPRGEMVTDYYESKYACITNGFDFDSLGIDEDSRFFIKKDSIEWRKYLAEPGGSAYSYLAKEGFSDNHILKIVKDATGVDAQIHYHS